MDPLAAKALADRGANVEGFRTRLLTEAIVRESDLIIAAGAEHWSEVVRLDARAARRAFTIVELHRLVEGLPVPDGVPANPTARAAALTKCAVAKRGSAQLAFKPDDDLQDPLGRGARAFVECVDRCQNFSTVRGASSSGLLADSSGAAPRPEAAGRARYTQPELSSKTRARLIDVYRDDIRELVNIAGRRLEGWLR